MSYQSEAAQIEQELQAAGARALLTLKEAATLARIHYITAWRAVQTRALPHLRRGRRILIRRSELARYLAGGSHE